ncbi:conserved domain protein [Bacteroides ovatus SD CMC 3f]|nr:conserved domain protein [Bacteroides ovatus SD CMC 3f]
MLIGWQIWNVIAIDKKIDGKVKQTSDSLTESINVTKKEMIEYIEKANEKKPNRNNDVIIIHTRR